MAFLIHSVDDGHVLPWEYLPAGAITPKVGLALIQTSGNLAIASGTTAPAYICMREENAAVAAGTVIPVVRVTKDTVYEVELSAAGTSLKVGQKVTVATDGLRCTATTTDGIAEIVEILGTAAGDKIRVRF